MAAGAAAAAAADSPAGGGRAEKNGAFQIGNLLPGKHYIRIAGGAGQGQGQGRGQAQGQAQGQWTLKSVLVGGQDVTDQPVELKPGQNVDNVTIVLTDRTTEVTGTVRDAKERADDGHHRDRVLDRSAVLARAVTAHPGGANRLGRHVPLARASARRLLHRGGRRRRAGGMVRSGLPRAGARGRGTRSHRSDGERGDEGLRLDLAGARRIDQPVLQACPITSSAARNASPKSHSVR